jgi:formylglycine-generating enzyme required for sulfatase activity
VIRGGSYNLSADYLQVGYRGDFNPYVAFINIGFRFARTN